jgi:hypothetical protein
MFIRVVVDRHRSRKLPIPRIPSTFSAFLYQILVCVEASNPILPSFYHASQSRRPIKGHTSGVEVEEMDFAHLYQL